MHHQEIASPHQIASGIEARSTPRCTTSEALSETLSSAGEPVKELI
jgi:hypothetical protein